ncbi:sulfotransferase family protein [Algiphilus sp.]|uniref:sulfotransferase family protein n=1 Tax=Algiphilus sp. TaxID=1872431 RepID=UPI003B515EA1
MPNVPNFLFIGPDKSGSTWIYQALKNHPQVFLSPVKELFFFDRYYEKGWGWYHSFFSGSGSGHDIVGEISHDYLFSELARDRIAEDIPNVKLMVCVRDPVERAFSAYLYMRKQGRVRGSFEAALESIGELVDHGLYSKHLKMYLERFPKEQIHVAVFDDLAENPQAFFSEVCGFLGIDAAALSEVAQDGALRAARPRSVLVARMARQLGWSIRSLGVPQLVTLVKESPITKQILYSEYQYGEKPRMAEGTREDLKRLFWNDVLELDALLETNLCQRWGFEGSSNSAGGAV